MSQDILNVILSGVGVVLSALCTWVASKLTKWLDTKVKDEKLKKFLNGLNEIIANAIKAVYQEYVEALKKEGKFDEEAQKIAKQKAINIIMNQLTTDMKSYIQENFGDVEQWLSQKIECVIYELKSKYKNNTGEENN